MNAVNPNVCPHAPLNTGQVYKTYVDFTIDRRRMSMTQDLERREASPSRQ